MVMRILPEILFRLRQSNVSAPALVPETQEIRKRGRYCCAGAAVRLVLAEGFPFANTFYRRRPLADAGTAKAPEPFASWRWCTGGQGRSARGARDRTVIELSQKEVTALQSALRQAWREAIRVRLVTGQNAERVAQAMLHGVYRALAAGERDEHALAAAALANLGMQPVEAVGEVVVDAAYVHAGNDTVH
jgi:hypothetical protein